MMNKILLIVAILTAHIAYSQRIVDFNINLYTDSLKKGTHNYINVDGKMSNGSWKPLTDKDLNFSSSYGKFEGNDLILPDNPTVNKVRVTVSLKQQPDNSKQRTIWIKQQPDPSVLPTYESIPVRSNKRGFPF